MQFRYLIAVTCGFCVDFILYAALVTGGISVYLANAAGFCVGAIINVILIRRYVFPNTRFQLSVDLPLSFVSYSVLLAVGMCALWGLINFASINPYWAKLLVNGFTFVLNYMIRNIYFNKR